MEPPRGPDRLLNASWPKYPRAVKLAPEPIEVEVRLVWDDGEEWCRGRPDRWTQRHVSVKLWHPRVAPVQGVWVAPDDVRRV
ncbi:hypothetical protein [Rudaeicoccus suwonensis]|uniref:Uncharacterized protein n=1 Tax=Rudaeicoccus suwonensis TaxID=657409 RepID=A0A561E4E4_9MICO|nr:hypothetical protein [Rudaeicoccus suwonensis]TWE10488.1 hypothetical protein BKA23_2851 [Rudaeicoccus suwonensis]